MKNSISVRLFSLTIAVVLTLCLFSVQVFAEEETDFETELTASIPENLQVGDTFDVNLTIKNIKTESGYIGFNIYIDYDSEYLSVDYSDSEPDEYDITNRLFIKDLVLPETWNDGREVMQNVSLEDDKESGTLILIVTAPLKDLDTISKIGLKDGQFSAKITFKCIEACLSTAVTIETDSQLAATAFVDNKAENRLGKGSRLDIGAILPIDNQSSEADASTDTSSPVTTDDDSSNTTLYIIIAVAAVCVAGAVIGILVFKKKKSN